MERCNITCAFKPKKSNTKEKKKSTRQTLENLFWDFKIGFSGSLALYTTWKQIIEARILLIALFVRLHRRRILDNINQCTNLRGEVQEFKEPLQSLFCRMGKWSGQFYKSGTLPWYSNYLYCLYSLYCLYCLYCLSCNRYDPLSRDVYCFKVTIVKRVSRIRVKSIILFVVGCPYVKIFNIYLSLFNIL